DVNMLLEQASRELENSYSSAEQTEQRETHGLTQQQLLQRSRHKHLKERSEYKEQCQEYLQVYGKYLEAAYDYELYQTRFRKIPFVLRNEGSSPAEQIVVVLRFPNVFNVSISPQGELLYNTDLPK